MNIFTDGVRLFVADRSNNRVLIWTKFPTENNEPADIVLGQPNMTSNTANYNGITAGSMRSPISLTFDGTRLFVLDYSNNRVLVWNDMPTTDGEPADFVLGQPTTTSNTSNNGGIGASSMYAFVYGDVYSDGVKVFVTDTRNHRVLIWNDMPTISGDPADIVLGQPNMTSNTLNNGGVSSSSLYYPSGVFYDSTRLYISDLYNNRILVWNNFPTVNGDSADVVLGQPNMTNNLAYGITASNASLANTWHVQSTSNKILVADELNNRLLIWNDIPTTNGEPADMVLGQPDMISNTANNGGISASSFNIVSSSWTDGERLLASDYGNNRVLIWNEFPTDNGEAADLVLGQTLMTTNTSNNGGRSASSLFSPTNVWSDGTKIYVVERSNNRILIWNEFPTVNKESADLVIGQPNMTTGTANTGGISASTLNGPYGVWSDGEKVVAADISNNRVLIWNEMPTTNGEAADIVLGQPDMISNTANNGGISSSSLYGPSAIVVDSEERLFVADRYNNRVLVWNTFPTENNQSADIVIGQPSFTTDLSDSGATRIGEPRGLSIDEENKILYISDRNNGRVLAYPLGPQNTNLTPLVSYTNTLIGNIFNLASDDAKDMMVSLDPLFTELT